MENLEKILIRKAGKEKIPINGSIELLPLCNMNCDMCYIRLSKEEMQKQGRLRTAQEWISVAQQMKASGVLFLLLTGGEPLLYPEFRKLFCELKKMGMILTINTNGTLINKEWVEFFQKDHPRRINITLYGASEDTYDKLCHCSNGFEKAMNGIRLLKEAQIPVKINVSAVKANKNDINKILTIGQQLDIPVSVDSYMMPATRERNKEYNNQIRLNPQEAAWIDYIARKSELDEKNYEEYRQRILWEVDHVLPDQGPRSMSCQAGKSSFSINWQGNMQPCVMMNHISMSVFKYDFATAWNYIVRETDKITLSSRCNSCNLRPLCRNCAACALFESGSYDALPDYMCQFAKESLRLLQEYVQKEGEPS